jgi:hypothetical protein
MLDRGGWRALWPGAKAVAGGWWSAIKLDPGPLFALYCGIWPWTLGLLAVMAALWWWGGDLQGRIKDQALRVWRFPA